MQEDPPSLGDVGQARAQKLIGVHMGNVLVTEVDGAAAGVHQTGDGLQNGALTGAVGADEGYDLPLAYLKGYPLDGMNGAIVNMNVVNFQHHAFPSSLPRYASMTAGLERTSSGVPFAMIRP